VNLIVNSKDRDWLHLKILELASRGKSYRQIAEELQVSLGFISNILHEIHQQSKIEVRNWINDLMPTQLRQSLMLHDFILSQASAISENSRDERVRLQALSLLRETDQAKRDLLTDSSVINEAISYIEKRKMKQSASEMVAHSSDDSSSTIIEDTVGDDVSSQSVSETEQA